MSNLREEIEEIVKSHCSKRGFTEYTECATALCELFEKRIARDIGIRDSVIKNLCEHDTEVRKIAEKVIGELDAQGDSYGVPVLETVMESVLAKFEQRIEPLRKVLNDKRQMGGRGYSEWVWEMQEAIKSVVEDKKEWA